MSNFETRLDKIEQQLLLKPDELGWLCIASVNDALVDNRQVFRTLEDVPASYQRDYPGIKVFEGVCPNDWD